ncbi:MAG: hypothetical protein HDR01_01460 [Lachnospiraceae bacterium]|nr:hypothetical protein [Lachnospiraceae bacterium]
MRRIYIILLTIMLSVLTGCGTSLLKAEKCDAYLEQSIEAIVVGIRKHFKDYFGKKLWKAVK